MDLYGDTSLSMGSPSGGGNLSMEELNRGIFQAGIHNTIGQSSVLSGMKTLFFFLKLRKR